jgi:hypothetical protein
MFKENVDIIFLDFAKVLFKHAFLKEDTTMLQIFECVDEFKAKEGFLSFAHYHLCECQREKQ